MSSLAITSSQPPRREESITPSQTSRREDSMTPLAFVKRYNEIIRQPSELDKSALIKDIAFVGILAVASVFAIMSGNPPLMFLGSIGAASTVFTALNIYWHYTDRDEKYGKYEKNRARKIRMGIIE